MSAEARRSPWSRLAAGIVILSAGVMFWLDQIGRLEARDYLDWWPLAPIAIGIAHLLERRWGAALVWIAIGSFFLLPVVGYDRPSLWLALAVWPLLISVAGATLVVQAVRSGQRAESGGHEFQAVAVMAGNVRRLASPTSGGQAVAVMGGCEIDISPAALRGEEIIIDVLAFWGGIDIRVPRGWNVVNHVAPILGAVEDKTMRGGEGAPRLVLRGSAIMGGVEIRNRAEAKA
ncbi:MAG TPA: DUF5668 domain-containing protein [Thermoanaerobaculia bacterium]|nr:DUF5668 domain-containing protein [Thermoanaerobaculia bacterium]